jgi:hypothetical protein
MDVTDGARRWETLARLIRHPVRCHALFIYSERTTSPRAIADALGARLNVVSYHTQMLLREGAIELVRTERRRGAREHFYRAVLGLEIGDAPWSELPVKLRRPLVRGLIDAATRESVDALASGGMDDAQAHMSRVFFDLDGRAQRELASLLEDTYQRAKAIDQASRERAAEDSVPHELVMMSFRRASSP